MSQVLDVRAVQHGSWWMVSVPGMPGLLAQVSSLEPRLLGAALATSSPAAAAADISVRRVVQVQPAQPAGQAALSGDAGQPGERGGASSWAQQAVRATRLAPRRVAELLAS
jgi:hypothetical protein